MHYLTVGLQVGAGLALAYWPIALFWFFWALVVGCLAGLYDYLVERGWPRLVVFAIIWIAFMILESHIPAWADTLPAESERASEEMPDSPKSKLMAMFAWTGPWWYLDDNRQRVGPFPTLGEAASDCWERQDRGIIVMQLFDCDPAISFQHSPNQSGYPTNSADEPQDYYHWATYWKEAAPAAPPPPAESERASAPAAPVDNPYKKALEELLKTPPLTQLGN